MASLRYLILFYWTDLETRLLQLESPVTDLRIAEVLKAKGELTVDKARVWAKIALEMLDKIRADVRSHLQTAECPFRRHVGGRLQGRRESHLPELPHVTKRDAPSAP